MGLEVSCMDGMELAEINVITEADADELLDSLYRDPKAIKDVTIGYAKARQTQIARLLDRAKNDPEFSGALSGDPVAVLTREGALSPLDTVTVRHSLAEGTLFGVRTRCKVRCGEPVLKTERRWLTLRLKDGAGQLVESEPFLALSIEISYTGWIEYLPIPRETSDRVSIALDTP
jgi:hypothetical protein